ncbi:hypothetical protein CAE01nite_20790 [Cellulomonas aerilata]|uniref:Uncharacterized protein n=1 Tax=Cellulomonas aerilata TaxID=515326 RepID=A0A512DD04_9CELL|nr:hypothetical protein CAE01nite_20790 [Cellulomonas aerilata]
MSVAEWASPVLSFVGAAVGAWLVYRVGRAQEWGRRFQAALDMLGSSDPRQRALGRARIVEICRHGAADDNGRNEALAVLREDVRGSCPDDVWRMLSDAAVESPPRLWIATDGRTRIEGDEIHVDRTVVESAVAYVDIAGGGDAAQDQVVALIAEAAVTSVRGASPLVRGASSPGAARSLPDDQRLILVKLNPDAAGLDDTTLRERARKSWRLSIERVRSEPPVGVAAVVQQRVVGAWEYLGVEPSAERPGRVEFGLGRPLPDLVGSQYGDTGQNPVRYWP